MQERSGCPKASFCYLIMFFFLNTQTVQTFDLKGSDSDTTEVETFDIQTVGQ